MSNIMELGIHQARSTMRQGFGGPFGAVIIKDGKVVAVESNSVLKSHDPTAHAEINAIRKAAAILGTHDLSGCELYTTCYPCPMCLSAIIWANIKKVYYGCTAKDAADIGFRDDFIYDYIKEGCQNNQILELEPLDREKCIKLFIEYHNTEKELY